MFLVAVHLILNAAAPTFCVAGAHGRGQTAGGLIKPLFRLARFHFDHNVEGACRDRTERFGAALHVLNHGLCGEWASHEIVLDFMHLDEEVDGGVGFLRGLGGNGTP